LATKLYFNPFIPAFSNIGVPIAESKLYFYFTNTTTKAPIFADAALTVPHTNPVLANLAGKYPPIYMSDAIVFRVVQTDKNDVQIGDAVDPYIPGSASPGPPGPPGPAGAPAVSLDSFYMAGDPENDYTSALQRAAAYITVMGGGVVDCTPGKVYGVGKQVPDGTSRRLRGVPLFRVDLCPGKIVIRGNGAIFKFNPGQYYGTFNSSLQPNTTNTAADACDMSNMFFFTNCSGGIRLQDLSFEGNIPNTIVGGMYGDVGIQLDGDFFHHQNCTGPITLENVDMNGAPRDGILGYGPNWMGISGNGYFGRNNYYFRNVRIKNCGRNGQHVGGGRGWVWDFCEFSYNGKPPLSANGKQIASPPASGVDVEAEACPSRDMLFRNCQFTSNLANGLVSDSGDNADITTQDCRFDSNPSNIWSNMPRMRHVRATIIGGMVRVYQSAIPEDATVFEDCRWTDRPNESALGVAPPMSYTYAVNMAAGSQNVRFIRPRFDMISSPALLVSSGAIFEDAVIKEGSGVTLASTFGAIIKGTNTWTSTVSPNISSLNYSLGGTLALNGVVTNAKTSAITPPAIAAGGVYQATVNLPTIVGVTNRTWDAVVVYDGALNGAFITKFVTTGGNVGVEFRNPTNASITPGAGNLYVRAFPTPIS
jgi:hypothetical protein